MTVSTFSRNNVAQIFDTLKYTKRALKAGLTQEQAEFHAQELANVINDSLVTKDHLRTELANSENRLTWRILGGIGVLIAISDAVGHFLR